MASDNFTYDATPLYGDKTDRGPVTNESQQWTAANAMLVKRAVNDIRSAILENSVNIKRYGVFGTSDDSSIFQDALDDTAGRVLYVPRGVYNLATTRNITTRSHIIVGDFGMRNDVGGTEIRFSGTGPCIQIGTDSGNPWTTNEYNGLQNHLFENIWFRHATPDTPLIAAGDGVNRVKIGAYGIWDWRGGGIVMRNVGLENFEATFVGIQSDINNFINLESHYSKWGVYIGPRSDQFSIHTQMSIFCDRAITIDGATNTVITNARLVGCGHSTAADIEVRLGSSSVVIQSPWLEHLQGYQGDDKISFVSAGEVSGYGAGGSIQAPGGTPNTSPVEAVAIVDPFCHSAVSGANHTRFLASVNKCHRFSIDRPSVKVGSALTNFDALVGIQAANSPTNAETQIAIRGASSGLSLADMFSNLGGGAPDISIDVDGPSGKHNYSSQRWSYRRVGAAAGADEFMFSQEGNSGEFWVIAPNHVGGQTERLRIARHMGTQANASAPASGTYVVGDWKRITDPVAGGYMCWVCVVGGTPGTWVKAGLVNKAIGFEVPDAFFATKAFSTTNELVAPNLTASQDNYTPTGIGDASVLVLTSTGAVSITGIATGANGRWLDVYNNNAVGGGAVITLENEDGASSAANQIVGAGGSDTSLVPKGCARLYYSPAITKWRVMSVSGL